MIDREALAAVPDPGPLRTAEVERAIDASAAYLASDEALGSIERDPYWPKWDSPWWHMLLLHQLGEARRIPARTAAAIVAGIDRYLHFFPLREEEAPGADLRRDVGCHCAFGTMSQALAACGIDVDGALPWFEPWFVRYQMGDGGLSCDETAYLAEGEHPSSMVATVPALEAMLLGDPARWSPARRAFIDRAAGCVLDRALLRGSGTRHNAAERDSAVLWPRLTFPRFYFYDALRGLTAVVRWAERTGQALPPGSVDDVVASLVDRFPDGVVRVERRVHADRTTLLIAADGAAGGRGPASSFPLLEATSRVGAPSEALSREWAETRAGLLRLLA